MSVRSSARLDCLALAALAAATIGCGKKEPRLKEADPAKVIALASKMVKNIPLPLAARDCKFEELVGAGATLTKTTLFQLAKEPTDPKNPIFFDYVNPNQLDSPAARQILDSSDEKLRRQAAAELLTAPWFLVYSVDLVDMPIPLGIKDFKKGHVGARAIRYSKTGNLECLYVFMWTNDPVKQAWAIENTNRPLVDPTVQKAMQEDLREQMLVRIAGLGAPPPKFTGPADDRHERHELVKQQEAKEKQEKEGSP